LVEMEPQAHPFREAFRNRDLEAMRELLADDVSFHSPVISEPGFEGKEAVLALYRVVFDAITDDDFTHEYGDSSARVLVSNGTVLGQPFKATNLVEFDPEGKVREIWVMARPLAGVAAIAEAMGSGLAARQGDAARSATRAASKPLRGMAALTDRVGGRIIGRLNRETA
jgi:hypothetical protein